MKKIYFYSLVLTLIGIFMASGVVYAQNNAVRTVPTPGEWGMIGTAILLGIAGLYKILRNR
jgi:uncharacterized membrane protein HdeD (DUF308 family)